MEEDNTSWIRRTKFSHTVCHRLDSSRLASLPLTLPEKKSGLKSRPLTASSGQKSAPSSSSSAAALPSNSQNQQHPLTNKMRSLSPSPQTPLPETFKEARSDRKRFLTPHPRRKESEKGIKSKLLNKRSSQREAYASSPLRHLGSMRISEKVKIKKESSWTKYFDHSGVRVNAVEAADEHSADMSQLFLGLRFAHGAHSRLYHGIYKKEPVAVKLIRVPDDDEDGSLAARLENQFSREVTLLSRLQHPNVIKVINLFSYSFAYDS